MTHTDRIRQMAKEADPDFGNLDGGMPDALCGIEAITRFAQLVAEDCARVCDERWRSMKSTEAAHYRQTSQAFSPAAFGFNQSDYAGKSFATTWRHLDLDAMCDAFHDVIEAHHARKNPFHNPLNHRAVIALMELKSIIPYMKAQARAAHKDEG